MSLIERAAAKLLEEKAAEAAVGGRANGQAFDVGKSEFDSEPVVTPTQQPIEKAPAQRFNLDFARLREKRCLTPDGEPRVLAQEYRRIKRPLLFAVKEALRPGQPLEGANLIMVTSAVPAEGKSFVSANLALSIASEVDQTVLLVDADVAKRGSSTLFGVETLKGLTDVARGQITLEETLIRTNVESLSLLPAGHDQPSMDELFASDAMTSLLRELSNRYEDRIIIIDTPPIFAMNVPQIIAKLMGQIVFVVEADSTPQHLVDEALEQLGDTRPVRLILNKASRRMPTSSYGYGYGYDNRDH